MFTAALGRHLAMLLVIVGAKGSGGPTCLGVSRGWCLRESGDGKRARGVGMW